MRSMRLTPDSDQHGVHCPQQAHPPLRRAGRSASSLAIALRLAWPAAVLSGCEGAMWGNLVVLAVSVGIFMGTLSLGRVR